MKKTGITTLMVLAFIAVAAVQSCKKKDEQPPVPSVQEFIADNGTFSNFHTWALEATNSGPSPSLGMAHAGNDSSVTRKVYFKNGQSRVNGKYPIGTVIVKHSTNPAGTVNEITAMVKRGNGFNPNAGDWEWFMLMPDGTIATDTSGMPMRGGATMMGGMCNSCHAGASAKDFTFSK